MDQLLRPVEIDSIFRSWNIKGGFVAAVKRNEDGSWREEIHCFGQRNEKGDPVTKETKFFIASNSKLFCALAAEKALREAGYERGLKTTIKTVVPEYQLQDPVATENATFEDALAHTTGLPRHDHYMTPYVRTLEDQLAAVKHMRPSLGFREGNQYHNVHFDLVALIIEKLAKCSYIDYVAEKILRPLGMHDTTVSADATLSSDNRAEGYWQLAKPPHGDLAVVVPCGMRDSSAATLGCGRMSSTAADMSTWLKTLLLRGRSADTGAAVLSEAAIERCMTGTVRFYEYARDYPELGPAVYGLGLSQQPYRGHTLVEHVGSLPGWMSRLMLVPEPGLELGLFIAVNNAPWGEMAGEEVKYAVLDRVFGFNGTGSGSSIDWHDRFLHERRGKEQEQAETLRKLIQAAPVAGGGETLTADKIAGVYRAPGFVTWTLDAAHVLEGPPSAEKIGEALPLPMVWGRGPPQPHVWPVGEADQHRYKMLWQFAFPVEMGLADVLGMPLDVEIDVDGEGGIRGFGLRGLWGAGKGVPSPEGETVWQRSEVYFEKVG